MIIYTHLQVGCVGNSGTTLWKLGEEGKEKRTIEHQQYRNTGRRHDMY
jgi:hypothetical protein